MRELWSGLAVVTLVSILASAAPAAAEGAPLRLAWKDPSGVAVGLEVYACAEAKDLLRKMGVAVSWRHGTSRELARPGEVRVILLDRAASLETGRPILGATPTTTGVAPAMWIHVPGVSSAIGLGIRRVSELEPGDRRALGIAIGRVVAHEVVHALAPSVPHGAGLMSAALGRRQLTAVSIPFAPEVALAVRDALGSDTPLPRPDTGVLAAIAGDEHPR